MLQLLYIIGIILALLWCVCWCGTKYTDHQQRKKEREMVKKDGLEFDKLFGLEAETNTATE